MLPRFLIQLLLVMGCCGPACSAPPAPGGFSSLSVSDAQVVRAAEFAIAERQKSGKEPGALTLGKIVSAESQVVAGTNYRLRLLVKAGGTEKTAEVMVWWQPWRKPDPYQLTSWRWE